MNYLYIHTIMMISFAYILGSIPSGFILGKVLKKIDIRNYGSGNVGATNVFRVLGWKLGLTAFVFDMLKGLVSVIVARSFFPGYTYLILASGITAIFGHIFSLFLKFKGGKGVATSAGVFIALTPLASVIAIFVFIVTVIITRYVSAGSILASAALFTSQLIITINNGSGKIEYLVIIFIVAFFIIYKHKSNITRLMNGTENRFTFSKKNRIV